MLLAILHCISLLHIVTLLQVKILFINESIINTQQNRKEKSIEQTFQLTQISHTVPPSEVTFVHSYS